MKVLFIGGTGTISTAISAQLQQQGHQLTLLNRGHKSELVPEGAEVLIGDIYNEEAVAKLLVGRSFDVVADFIAFSVDAVKRDYRLFKDITKQYIFISSASAYQKPPVSPVITESTPLHNPYWQYSHNKMLCEDYLMERFRQDDFPVTIVRPSHTYSKYALPLAVHGDLGPWQVLKRMLEGKPVIIPGDGSSLWTVTHNSDFAQGFIGLMGNPHAIGQAVHITNDERLSWTQIHEIVAAKLGVTLNPLYVPSDYLAKIGPKYNYDFKGALLGDKAHSVIFDNSKIKSLVPEYCAHVRFDQGAGEAVDYLLAHPELQVEDETYEHFCNDVAAAFEQAQKHILA